VIDDPFPLVAEPYEFVVKTWNRDYIYEHQIQFAVTIDPARPEEEVANLSDILLDLGLIDRGQ